MFYFNQFKKIFCQIYKEINNLADEYDDTEREIYSTWRNMKIGILAQFQGIPTGKVQKPNS